ncbi:RAD52 DNA repair protein [Tirmania nivea]|nr:RAD52 DNA repair protein [Tirmania nivea]
MPEPGFQHKLNGVAQFNPFDEEPQKLTPYTVEEITTLQSRLDKQLGPEYISSRPGAGGAKVHYLAADKVISLANEVFGFNGWSSSIRNIQIDFVDVESGKVSLGLSVIMRVTLKDGTYHEDVGYGQIENCRGKAAAFEKAKKEGATDALKRALRNFGNVLGNCVYDKNYIKEVTKLRPPPQRFNSANLYRHGDHAQQQRERGSSMVARDTMSAQKPVFEDVKPTPKMDREESNGDEYGGDEFDDEFSHIFVEGEDSTIDGVLPDEIVIEPSNSTPTDPPNNNRNRFGGRPQMGGPGGPSDSPLANKRPSTSQFPPINNPQTPTPEAYQQYQRPPAQGNVRQKPPLQPSMQPAQRQGMGPPQTRPPQIQNQPPGPRAPTPTNIIHTLPAPQLNPNAQKLGNQQSMSVGFFSARAAESLQGDNPPLEAPPFNPHQQTSIPRSLGIDHSKSSPIPRKLLGKSGGPGGPGVEGPIFKPDFNLVGGFNSGARQIGMPPQGVPRHNTTPYRPPSAVGAPQGYQGAGTKRLSDGVPIGNSGNGLNTQRQALNDASNAQLNANRQEQGQQQFNGSDPKRLRS